MADAELERRALSAERWAMLARYFDGLGPGKVADLQLSSLTVGAPIETEGVTFLPAVYYPA